ncbi:hypothetical protein MTR_3g088250 [Medicago truncatula]|uniref:Uncharacterized protein n=1 Tax=Medicago truncatula TaxID=3880 RepID=A0A072V0V3_MEDTR|nr:hypothetical protein MTR_3g088250 [Medicago truncatula]
MHVRIGTSKNYKREGKETLKNSKKKKNEGAWKTCQAIRPTQRKASGQLRATARKTTAAGEGREDGGDRVAM